MKFTTKEQKQGYMDAVIEGGLKGGALGAAFATPVHMFAKRQFPYYRNLPIQLKVLGGIAAVIPAMYVGAENGGQAFSRSQWTGIGKKELDLLEQREEERWEKLDAWEQVGDWASRRKWAILGTSWAGAMVGSFALVSRNNYQSFAQRLVQARVYAQAITVGMILVTAVLTGTGQSTEDTVGLRTGDSSWRDILEQEGYGKELREDQKRSTQMNDAKRVAQPVPGA